MEGVIEHVPAWTSLTVYYDPARIGYRAICTRIAAAAANLGEQSAAPARMVTIPVCYGGEFGPDLEDVARGAGLTVDEAVALHSGAQYVVGMMGFSPGFAYLAGLPARLVTPRLATPRLSVPAGSVGIGGSQTGVYPIATPGGWRIIGRTTLRLFDPAAENPFLLQPGDAVSFEAITRKGPGP